MYVTNKHISRRTVLRGVGASVALPFLEAMIPANKAWAGATGPTRLVCMEMVHGAAGSNAIGAELYLWAPAAVGVPLPIGALTDAAVQETGEVDADVSDFLGQVLLFKIAEVRYAQPGLYPILKPREIGQWFDTSVVTSGRDPQETFELFLQHSNVPWIRRDMAFIPCPPFTVIGFNSTTDVFLASATERIDLITSAPSRPAKKAEIPTLTRTEAKALASFSACALRSKPSIIPAFSEKSNSRWVRR